MTGITIMSGHGLSIAWRVYGNIYIYTPTEWAAPQVQQLPDHSLDWSSIVGPIKIVANSWSPLQLLLGESESLDQYFIASLVINDSQAWRCSLFYFL